VSPRALYVHIPFCAHVCAYCDFPKVLFNEKWAFSYFRWLREEFLAQRIGLVDTIYIGGGTPTSLPDDLFESLLSLAEPHLAPNGEFTVEANPENLTEAKLAIMRKYRVNRLSIGIESSQDKFLALMGRKHTFEDARKAVGLARNNGFTNINCDLIYALPKETLEDLDKDIDALLSLDVPHLSTYCLSINKGTAFYNQGLVEADNDLAADQYERILGRLRKEGYDRYEVSNFAKPGFESRHNLTYWRDEEYYAVGMGASGYVNGVRYDNTRNLAQYLAGHPRGKDELVTKESDLTYFFLTNLRLEKGFDPKVFERRFGFSFASRYAEKASSLAEKGLLVSDPQSIRCTDKGLLLLDEVLLELM
jgi:putative oxygen-independent coproporphyrinogen III oxidase